MLEEIKKALESINSQISTFDSSYTYNYTVQKVVTRELFMDEIHDFPTLMVTNQGIQFIQLSNNLRHKVYSCRIRAIVYDENTIESGELLAQDIEHVLENYRKWEYRFEEVRLTRIETDAGINAPYGAVIISFTVVGQYE